MNFCILLILRSIKYISAEELCYTVLFFKSLKILDLLYKIFGKYSFPDFFRKSTFSRYFQSHWSQLDGLNNFKLNFGLKFSRLENDYLGCGSPII